MLTNGAAALVDGLACVEAGIAAYGEGSQGMVHMTAQALTHYVTNGTVVKDGTTYVTPNGNLVVPDAGYDGSGPDVNGAPNPASTSQWIYGTSMVSLRMGVVEILPGEFAEAVDRSDNTVTFWAQQIVAAEWDHCVHVAAEINLPPCLTGGWS